MRFSTVSRSLSCSSVSIISLSRTGSTLPSTCTTLPSSKQRSTCMMASVSRILPKNWLPRPSPFEAPFTRPAMSTISTVVGTMRPGCTSSASLVRRSSGTVITPTLGSMVQKGKLADCALALLRQLNRVDLPTLGRPTMPHCKLIYAIVCFVIISDGKVTIYLRQKQHFLTSSIHLPNKMTQLTDFQYAPFNGTESDEVRILRCFFVCELYSPR